MTTFDADVIVIGSGPAGVSAAFPLVEAGRRVLMIDGGRGDDMPAPTTSWDTMLGRRLEALKPDDGLSPKLRTPAALHIIEPFRRWAGLCEERFYGVGALARGGLSRVWGGFVSEFDADDLRGWPLTHDDLAPSYRDVASRIGISGADDDLATFYGTSADLLPPPPIGPLATATLARYRNRRPDAAFKLGLARNALLTVDRNNRQACDLSLGCLWGCSRGAIYDARQDVALLRMQASFRLLDGVTAEGLVPLADGWEVVTGHVALRAPRIVVAAGTLGTMRLVAPLLDPPQGGLRLLNSPVVAMPFLVPAGLGREPPMKGYSLAQLGYRQSSDAVTGDYVTGGFYEIAALPPSSFVSRLPFGRQAGTELFRWLASALAVVTVYFPGTCSANTISFERSAAGGRLHIRGGVSPDFPRLAQRIRRDLTRNFRRLGAYALPGASLATAGTDVHLGGLFPMGSPDRHGTSRYGELNAAPGIHIVDGASLPTVPAKYTTLTIMANADRIGRHLVNSG